jgi:hypothetical protein
MNTAVSVATPLPTVRRVTPISAINRCKQEQFSKVIHLPVRSTTRRSAVERYR